MSYPICSVLIMEEEQKEILDGVIVDISRFSLEKRKELLGFSGINLLKILKTPHNRHKFFCFDII
jgi:hypothetical protein